MADENKIIICFILSVLTAVLAYMAIAYHRDTLVSEALKSGVSPNRVSCMLEGSREACKREAELVEAPLPRRAQ